MSEQEREVVRELIDAMIVKHQVTGAVERVTKPAAKGKKKPMRPEEKR